MAQEIERKYLINHEKWQQMEKPAGELYRQGYLITDPHKTIRVRLTPTAGFLTIKGISTGPVRLEYEYEIPVNEAQELLNNFSVSELIKRRYKIEHHGKTWEIDEFEGDNEGLIVAEIELMHEHEPFKIPKWVEREVTGIEKYYNSNLTTLPYKNW